MRRELEFTIKLSDVRLSPSLTPAKAEFTDDSLARAFAHSLHGDAGSAGTTVATDSLDTPAATAADLFSDLDGLADANPCRNPFRTCRMLRVVGCGVRRRRVRCVRRVRRVQMQIADTLVLKS